MKLVADSARYSSDNRFSGFMLLVLLSSPLVIISTSLLLTPPELFEHAMPAALAFAIGSIAVLLLFGLFLKTRGLIFKIPIRVYEDGVLVQPTSQIRPKVIEWMDLMSLELWEGLPYKKTKSGAVALTPAGEIKSTELFKGKEPLKEFINTIRPYLEDKGMKVVQEDEGESHYSITFRRGLPF